jgi:hypothetical protein
MFQGVDQYGVAVRGEIEVMGALYLREKIN